MTSSAERLVRVLEDIRDNLISQQLLNDELRSISDGTGRIRSAEKAKEKLIADKDDREKRLLNFIESHSRTYRGDLKEFNREKITGVYNEMCSDVDNTIKTYRDYNDFAGLHGKGLAPAAHYSILISEKMNSLKTGVNKAVSDRTVMLLQHLYRECIERAEQYVKSPVKSSAITVHLAHQQEKFEMDDSEFRDAVAKLEKQKSDSLAKKVSVQKEKADLATELIEFENSLRSLKDKKSSSENN